MNLLLDVHLHTTASGHAYSTIKEYVGEAKNKNLKLIGITDHAPEMPGTVGLFHFVNFAAIPDYIDGVRVLKGAEVNIMDKEGLLDLPEKILERLDIVIASLHGPCIEPSTIENNTETLINVMKNPLVDIIGHPGDPNYPIDTQKIVECAKQTNKILEINNCSLIPNRHRYEPELVRDVIRMCKKYSQPIIVGSDAHIYTECGEFTYAIDMLLSENMPEELILNTDINKFANHFNITL